MKTKAIYLLTVASIGMLALSCSKKNDVQATTTINTFTINGNTYTPSVVADSAGTSIDGPANNLHIIYVGGYTADKSKTGVIEMIFSGGDKPKAGKYKVINTQSDITAGQVSIVAYDQFGKIKTGLFTSTGTDGVYLSLTLSSSGKISAVLPTTAISGTEYDNTDPNNTVETDITGSVSGTVSE